jgi:hypothetical protein
MTEGHDCPWIDDAVSSRLDREYLYAEKRAAYNLEHGNFDMATRWAMPASGLFGLAQEVCFRHEQADA